MSGIKNFSKTILIIFISTLAGLIFCEMVLRVKHHFLIDYDIEMWRYAKELKIKVNNKKINHIHVKNKSAKLQDTIIKINKYGQRDINYDNELLEEVYSVIILAYCLDQFRIARLSALNNIN